MPANLTFFLPFGSGPSGSGGPGVSTLVDSIDTRNSSIANALEQNLNPNALAVAAGTTRDFDRFKIRLSASKNGTTNLATIRFRYGPTRGITDNIIATVAATDFTALQQSEGFMIDFKRLSATSLQKLGNASVALGYNGGNTSAFPAAVTVSSMDTNAMYLSITAQTDLGTEIVTIEDYTFQILSGS